MRAVGQGLGQSHDVRGHILVLVMSAVGGSMVPRFLMPPELQGLGWFTPNTWVLEAYSAVFWQQPGTAVFGLPLYLLWI